MNRVLLNALRFLQLALEEMKQFPQDNDYDVLKNELGGIEMILLNLDNNSIQNVLLQVYISECSNLLGRI